MHREKDTLHNGGKQIKLGVVPKLLLGILCPLIISMLLVTIFLGLRGSAIVNEIMNDQLNAQANEAANASESFFNRYYGVAECLAATQIVRDTTTEYSAEGFVGHDLYGSLMETLRLIQQDYADEGEIVVALVGENATLKRFYKRGHKIILHPENKAMQDIIVDDCQIQGVLVSCIKMY